MISGVDGQIDCEYILRQCRLYSKRRASVYALLLMDSCDPKISANSTNNSSFWLGINNNSSFSGNTEDIPVGGLLYEAVGEALLTDVNLAKEIARSYGLGQEDVALRKQLWLSIARHVVQTAGGRDKSEKGNEVKSSNLAAVAAIALIKESDNIINIDVIIVPFSCATF